MFVVSVQRARDMGSPCPRETGIGLPNGGRVNRPDGRTKKEFITIKRRVFYIVTKKGSIFNGSSGDDMYLTRKKLILVD